MNDFKMSVLKASAVIVSTILFCLVGKCEAADASIKIDDPIKSILCQGRFQSEVKCTSQVVLLRFGICATQKDNQDIFTANCPYFELNGHNVTEPGYIQLPDNISELNDYMCRPMNRKGFLCKDCIDGFGPSVTSLGYKCSNCTDAWYGIPLYLAVELISITLFYLIILIFKVHLTSAPMPLFIFYCNLVMYELLLGRAKFTEKLLLQDRSKPLLMIILFFYGIWNSNFIQYITPPFCVSSRLKPTHIELLDYAFVICYPLFLIFLTWICVELHGRNWKFIVCLWRPFHKCFIRLQKKWEAKSDLIDVFASFLLLFYVKNMYLGSVLYRCFALQYTLKGINYNSCVDIDGHFTRQKYAYLVIPLMIVLNVCPALFLILYPLKWFRVCLTKCRLDKLFVTTFIEKFHGCYRDGLNGGRDMRSFSGLYIFLIFLVQGYEFLHLKKLNLTIWHYRAIVFLLLALLIAFMKPYKKNYMNVLDTLLLAFLAVFCIVSSNDDFPRVGEGNQILILLLFPVIVSGAFVIFKIIAKLKLQRQYMYCYKACKQLIKNATFQNQHSSSRLLGNPTSTIIDIRKYGTFSEVSIQ